MSLFKSPMTLNPLSRIYHLSINMKRKITQNKVQTDLTLTKSVWFNNSNAHSKNSLIVSA